MRQIIALILVSILHYSYAQEKSVALVVTGIGEGKEEALKKALRSAIEQAFGVFISSKTEILNDELITDQITSVAQGNIRKYNILNESSSPELGYSVTLSAEVSVDKLISFVESKGIEVEFKGSLFAFNVNQQLLNENNEFLAIEQLCEVANALLRKGFDYRILNPQQPVSADGSADKFNLAFEVEVTRNRNFAQAIDVLDAGLKGLSMSASEAENYITLKRPVFPVVFIKPDFGSSYFILRNANSQETLRQLLSSVGRKIFDFIVDAGSVKIRGKNQFLINWPGVLSSENGGLEHHFEKNNFLNIPSLLFQKKQIDNEILMARGFQMENESIDPRVLVYSRGLGNRDAFHRWSTLWFLGQIDNNIRGKSTNSSQTSDDPKSLQKFIRTNSQISCEGGSISWNRTDRLKELTSFMIWDASGMVPASEKTVYSKKDIISSCVRSLGFPVDYKYEPVVIRFKIDRSFTLTQLRQIDQLKILSMADYPEGDFGMTLTYKNRMPRVSEINPDGPAAKAGIKIDDVILAIGDGDNCDKVFIKQNFQESDLESLREKMLGLPGSPVCIKIVSGTALNGPNWRSEVKSVIVKREKAK